MGGDFNVINYHKCIGRDRFIRDRTKSILLLTLQNLATTYYRQLTRWENRYDVVFNLNVKHRYLICQSMVQIR